MENTTDEKPIEDQTEISPIIPTGEEPMEIPTIAASEIPGTENNPTEEIGSLKPKQEIEKMEVPHHSHREGRKSLKSYAWEFLMLFLAVFCGFLAEYFLEHRIEKEKGKQFVRSMVEDIVSDSTKINQSLEFGKKQELGLDSLSVLFNSQPPYDDSTIKKMYVLMLKYTMKVSNVAFTKRTLSQLKNSGAMRLISNKQSADEITRYSEGADDIESQGIYFENIALNEVIKLNTKIFYLKYIKGITRKNINDFVKGKPIKLASDNENLLTEYSNQLFFTTQVLINYNNKLTRFRSELTHTLGILKKEYHIK